MFDLYNNIIFGNVSTGGSGYDAYFSGTGSTCIVSNNDINDISGVFYGHNNINADPKFYDPINGDYHLQCCATPASPCLNTGDAQAPSLPATDLDGNPRLNLSSQVDIGCYELNTTAFILPIPPNSLPSRLVSSTFTPTLGRRAPLGRSRRIRFRPIT